MSDILPVTERVDSDASRRRRPIRGRSPTITQGVKYQVFISSTFKDLIEERQAVSRAVLELNHIPAGMELFPAFDQEQLDFIKRVIDNCDYYIIILGGRYGSLTPQGISFIEAEYDYAVEQKKPIIALIHADTGKIPAENVDTEPLMKEKLQRFQYKLQSGRLVKHWSNINELKSHAIVSLTTSFDQLPQMGWRRNDGRVSEEYLRQLEYYRLRNEDFAEKTKQLRHRLTEYEDLDNSEIDIKYSGKSGSRLVSVPADQMIREFAAPLKNGFSRVNVEITLLSLVRHRYDSSAEIISDESIDSVILFFGVFEITEENTAGDYYIRDDKLHLLKSAFKKQPRGSGEADDEIPF